MCCAAHSPKNDDHGRNSFRPFANHVEHRFRVRGDEANCRTHDRGCRLGLCIPDYVASAAKALLGAAPFAGSLLAEIAGTIIPNQRIDRLARFAVILEEKLAQLDREFVRAQLTDENFTNIMEDSIR